MTMVTQETVVIVDDSPLRVVDFVGDASLPALHIELAPGVRLYGTTKDLVDFAGAIVDAVDVALARVATA